MGVGGPDADGTGMQLRRWPDFVLAPVREEPAAGDVGRFYVDPERAQQCINGLKVLRDDLERAVTATESTYFDPPGWDGVSVNMARQAAIMSERAAGYVLAWQAQIDMTIKGLEQQLDAYRAVDEDNAVTS